MMNTPDWIMEKHYPKRQSAVEAAGPAKVIAAVPTGSTPSMDATQAAEAKLRDQIWRNENACAQTSLGRTIPVRRSRQKLTTLTMQNPTNEDQEMSASVTAKAVVWSDCFGVWTSVETSLPEYGIGVLVATDNGKVTAASREKCECFWRKVGVPYGTKFDPQFFEIMPWRWTSHECGGCEWEFDFDERAVTHWMPLPPLPNAKLSHEEGDIKP